MKYTPTPIEGNANVSHSSPLGELILLLGGIIGILLVVYVALGFAVDMIVPRLPAGIERHIGAFYSAAFQHEETIAADTYLQTLADRLVEAGKMQPDTYRVHLVSSSQANAFALPGGHIVVLSGLLEEIASENELAFILAHELGHFAHRDHLRGLGRGLVLMAMSSMLLGVDNALTDFLIQSMLTIEMRFSQAQETQADLFGLALLQTTYGHIAGAADFFEKMAKADPRGRLAYFFATHPYPKDRIATLRQEIQQRGYAVGEKIPPDECLQEIPVPQQGKNTTLKDILGL